MSVESAFARLKQIRTLRTVMLAFAAIGFGLFTGPILQGLYVEERVRPRRARAGSARQPRRALRRSPSCRSRPGATTPASAQDPARGAAPGRAPDPPRRRRGPDPVLDAERAAPSPSSGSCRQVLLDDRVHDGRADPAVGRALPPPGHGRRARVDLHLLHRGHRRRARSRRSSSTPSARRPRCCS